MAAAAQHQPCHAGQVLAALHVRAGEIARRSGACDGEHLAIHTRGLQDATCQRGRPVVGPGAGDHCRRRRDLADRCAGRGAREHIAMHGGSAMVGAGQCQARHLDGLAGASILDARRRSSRGVDARCRVVQADAVAIHAANDRVVGAAQAGQHAAVVAAADTAGQHGRDHRRQGVEEAVASAQHRADTQARAVLLEVEGQAATRVADRRVSVERIGIAAPHLPAPITACAQRACAAQVHEACRGDRDIALARDNAATATEGHRAFGDVLSGPIPEGFHVGEERL